MGEYVSRLKYVKLYDLYHLFLFLLAYPLAKIFRLFNNNIWLVCEEKKEARDNGFVFYKYLCENHKEVCAVYAIDKKSPDFNKVNGLGKVISYGSFMHWIYYLAAARNISSQKGGKPNAAVCFLLEVIGSLKSNRVFLQHGVIINKLRWLYYDVTKVDLFITSAKPEYDYVKKYFGYPLERIVYTGLARHDKLHNVVPCKNRVLVMPTWRNWLSRDTYYSSSDFLNSDYFREWSKFINSDELYWLARNYNLEVIFYPHRNMQKFLHFFKTKNKNIIIADWKEWDIQDLLKTSSIMITDYSSVIFDFIYMKKPVLFYQFDADEFRRKQYEEGYFNYSNNKFGATFDDIQGCISKIEEYVKSDYKVDKKYLEEHRRYFPIYDNNNCNRIFNSIIEMSSD